MKNAWTRSLAVTLSACLLWTSGDFAHAFQPTSATFELTPPASLGHITDSFSAGASTSQPAKQMILIQDLHANYGVQKNIAGLLEFLAKKLPKTRRTLSTQSSALPFALAVEGASGPVDSSVMALFPDKAVKEAAADYLMREGELSGAEYFAVMRGAPKLLVGVEDDRYYTLHRDLFRQTLEKRTRLVEMLRGIQSDIRKLRPVVYSKSLKKFQAKLDALETGSLSLPDYLGYLAAESRTVGMTIQIPDLSNAKAVARAWEDAEALGFMLQLQKAQTPREKDLVQVEHDLGFLVRVADLQATEKDVRTFGPRLNQFIALCQSLLESNGIHRSDEASIRELISSSIDYYALALARNKPMVENTLALLDRRTEDSILSTVVLVAGGFHTRQITELLRQKNVGYAVITPNIDQSKDSDQALYVKRLSGQLLTEADILAAAPKWPASPTQLAKTSSGRGSALAVGAGIVGAGVFLTLALVASAHGANMPNHLPHFIQANLGSLMGLPGVKEWVKHIPSLLALAGGTLAVASVVQPSKRLIPIRLHVAPQLEWLPFVVVQVNEPITGRSLINEFRKMSGRVSPLYLSVDGKYLELDQLLSHQAQRIDVTNQQPGPDAEYWPREVLTGRSGISIELDQDNHRSSYFLTVPPNATLKDLKVTLKRNVGIDLPADAVVTVDKATITGPDAPIRPGTTVHIKFAAASHPSNISKEDDGAPRNERSPRRPGAKNDERGFSRIESKLVIAGGSLALTGGALWVALALKGIALTSGAAIGSAAAVVVGLATLGYIAWSIFADRRQEKQEKIQHDLKTVEKGAEALRSTPVASPVMSPMSRAIRFVIGALPKASHPQDVSGVIEAERRGILSAA